MMFPRLKTVDSEAGAQKLVIRHSQNLNLGDFRQRWNPYTVIPKSGASRSLK